MLHFALDITHLKGCVEWNTDSYNIGLREFGYERKSSVTVKWNNVAEDKVKKGKIVKSVEIANLWKMVYTFKIGNIIICGL